jgi:hypothetical protein
LAVALVPQRPAPLLVEIESQPSHSCRRPAGRRDSR